MRILALLTLVSATSAFAASDADREKAFKADIAPILEKSCAGCHGKDPAKKPKGGFNIMTLEDLVEYQLPLIRQTSVREGSVDFHSGIKALMRQDPDIIFVGEVRDGVLQRAHGVRVQVSQERGVVRPRVELIELHNEHARYIAHLAAYARARA